jgi:hypothetical protein
MLESKIENAVVKHGKLTGWLSFKFNSASYAGVPDRIFIRSGQVIFIEFKAPGKKPRKLQTYTINSMLSHGAKVFVVDEIEKGKRLLDAN